MTIPMRRTFFLAGWNEWDQSICHLFLLRAAAEKPWRTNSPSFSFLKLKSSELLNMCAAIKIWPVDQNGIVYPILFLHPHVPTSSSATGKTQQQVSLARFSMSQLTGLYRISQRERAETSPPSSCLWESLQMSLCFFAAALKIADDCSIQVLLVKMFSLHLACLPQWLGLCRHSDSPRLCCVSFSLWWRGI